MYFYLNYFKTETASKQHLSISVLYTIKFFLADEYLSDETLAPIRYTIADVIQISFMLNIQLHHAFKGF